jgi:hypothetical protein
MGLLMGASKNCPTQSILLLIEDAKIRGQVWNLPLPSKIGFFVRAGSKSALVNQNITGYTE